MMAACRYDLVDAGEHAYINGNNDAIAGINTPRNKQEYQELADCIERVGFSEEVGPAGHARACMHVGACSRWTLACCMPFHPFPSLRRRRVACGRF